MPRMIGSGLSRREREILDALHRLSHATAGEVRAALPDPPTDSAVRSLLRILENKGHIRHEEEGQRYLYSATEPRNEAAKSALQNVVQTFFAGSLEGAVKAFLAGDDAARLSDDELDRMAELIDAARRERDQKETKA